MNRQKIFISSVFFVLVMGAIMFLSQSAFGSLGDCICSPDWIFPAFVCPPGSSLDSWGQKDDYCLHGSCVWVFEFWCQLWTGGTTKTYVKEEVTVRGYQLDCCDPAIPWS